jgi:alginate O-acetyltransferase complex protein AlgI
MIGWVLFRSPDLGHALEYLLAMAGFATGDGVNVFVAMYLSRDILIALGLGILFSAPVYAGTGNWIERVLMGSAKWVPRRLGQTVSLVHVVSLIGIFVLCAVKLASGTYNPFIYFRF